MSAPTPSRPLPPVLYWSATLAAHLNAREGEDAQHGLIDLTVATVPLYWTAANGPNWAVFGALALPADTVRLVADTPVAEATTEWAVRWSDAPEDEQIDHLTPTDDGGESYARRVHAQYPLKTEVVSREVRRGPWNPERGEA